MYISEHVAAELMEEYKEVFDELEAETNTLEVEDDAPMDNIVSERQKRLLVDTLYASWKPNEPFLALANVGVFSSPKLPPIVPDMFLSLGVEPHPNLSEYDQKKHRTYLIWQHGKPPDLVLEIVSNLKGQEFSEKLSKYAELGVEYYVVYDPLEMYGKPSVRVFVRRSRQYEEIDEAVFPDVGLRLQLWEGAYQGLEGAWLRWFTMDGKLLAVGEELDAMLTKERKHSAKERKRASEAESRASEAESRASEAESRASEAESRAEALAAKLRALGIEP